MCNPRGNQSKFFYGSRLWLYSVLLLSAIIGVRAEQLPIQVYTTANNLIYEGVRRIYQDSRGLIWFSTPVGVSRFDGYQFTNYGMEDGLTYPGIVDLVEDANGIYWFGTTGYGIYRFDPRSPISSEHGKSVAPKINFVNYSVSDNAASNHIYRFFKTSKGEVLVGTAGGLFRLDGSESNRKFSRVELNVPSAPNEYFGAIAFAEDAEGNLWIGHQRGLTRRLTDGRMITYAVQPNAASDWIYSLTIDQNNRIWAITDNRGLIVFNPEPVDSISDEGAPRQIKFTTDNRFSGNLEPGSAYRFKPEENLADGEFLNVLETSDGTIWLTARTKGLVKFDGREFRLYTKANGLSDNRTDDLLEDSFGNLWVGSGFGAMKFPRKGFVTYNVEDGLASEVIFNVF